MKFDRQYLMPVCFRRMCSLSAMLIISLSPYSASSAFAQKHNRDEKATVQKKKPREKISFDASSTIESLENRNPRPLLVGSGPDYEAVFDKEYDWSEYNRVMKIIPTLVEHAEVAWPQLVEHLRDNRYCTTVKLTYSVTFTKNYSIGDVCRKIMAGWLSAAYGKHISEEDTDIWPSSERGTHLMYAYFSLKEADFARDNKRLKSWCEKRKDMPLYELQIDTCRWAITDVPHIPDLSDKEKQMLKSAIEGDIESLRKSKEPIHFDGFPCDYFKPFSSKDAKTSKPEPQNVPGK
jgi:hypothetical protein